MSEIGKWTQIISDWFIKVTRIYFSSTPENVEVKGMDASGEVVTMTIPNVAKFRKTVWDNVAGATSLWHKTYYVDQATGDDTNSGSSSSPFQTIDRAIEVVPSGGKGYINIVGAYNHNTAPAIHNKIISIRIYDSFNIGTYVSNGATKIYGFKLYHSQLTLDIRDSAFVRLVPKDTADDYYVKAASISGVEGSNTLILLMNNSTILMSEAGQAMVSTPFSGMIDVIIRNYNSSEIITNGAYFITLPSGTPAKLSLGGGSPFDDISFAVSGIIRDSDSGNPVNLLSNYNFSS